MHASVTSTLCLMQLVVLMQELTVLLRAKLRVWQQLGGPTMTTFIVII